MKMVLLDGLGEVQIVHSFYDNTHQRWIGRGSDGKIYQKPLAGLGATDWTQIIQAGTSLVNSVLNQPATPVVNTAPATAPPPVYPDYAAIQAQLAAQNAQFQQQAALAQAQAELKAAQHQQQLQAQMATQPTSGVNTQTLLLAGGGLAILTMLYLHTHNK